MRLRQVVPNHFHYGTLLSGSFEFDINRDRIIIYESIRSIEQVLNRYINFEISKKLHLEIYERIPSPAECLLSEFHVFKFLNIGLRVRIMLVQQFYPSRNRMRYIAGMII